MTRKKIFCYILLSFMLGVLIVTGVTGKLATGGRWGLGQPVAMADRFLNGGGLFYSMPDTSFCAASAYYFPGIVFLAIFIRGLFGAQCETVMIVCAWVLIILGLYLFSYISTKIVVQATHSLIPCCIAGAAILFFEFYTLKGYAGEWHPDYLVIVCAMSGCLFLEKIISQERYKYHFGYIISLILCGISKQTGVIFYFAYALYIIFCPELSIKRKGILFLEMFLSGIIVLGVIFNIHGCYITTVYTMSRHPLVDLGTYLGYWKGAICECWFFLLLIILYGIRCAVKKIKKNSHKSNHIIYIWEICACLWFIVSIAGSFKYGSNKGNIEAGLIIWMPFAIYTLVDLVSKIIEKKRVLIRILTVCFFSISVIYISIISKMQIANNIIKYKSRLADQQKVEEYLDENLEGKTIAYNAAYYFYVCNAEINLSTDTHLIHHYYYAGLLDNERFNFLSKTENWDMIVWLEQWDNAGGLIIPEGYEVRKIDDLNCLGKIYVKKE